MAIRARVHQEPGATLTVARAVVEVPAWWAYEVTDTDKPTEEEGRLERGARTTWQEAFDTACHRVAAFREVRTR